MYQPQHNSVAYNGNRSLARPRREQARIGRLLESTNDGFTKRNKKARKITKTDGLVGQLSVERYGLIGAKNGDYDSGYPDFYEIEFWLKFTPVFDNISSTGLNFIQIMSREIKFKNKAKAFIFVDGAGINHAKLSLAEQKKGFILDGNTNNTPCFNQSSAPPRIKYGSREQVFEPGFQVLETESLLDVVSSGSGNFLPRQSSDVLSINLYDPPVLTPKLYLKNLNGNTAQGYGDIDYFITKVETYVVGLDEKGDIDGKIYTGLRWGFYYSNLTNRFGKYELQTLHNFYSPELPIVLHNFESASDTNFKIPELVAIF